MAKRSKKTKPGMHPEDIKAAIRKRGETLQGLARRNHYSETYLRRTLLKPMPRGEKIISDFLGIAPWRIWPDRYERNGSPKAGRVVRTPYGPRSLKAGQHLQHARAQA